MKRELARLAEERAEAARELLAVFDAAAQPILGNAAVWVEESRRDNAEPLPWPLQSRGEGEAQLLRIFAAATVESVLQAIEDAHGPQWVPPEDPSDPDFQYVLRVARRAVDAAAVALRARFGGAGRLSIKRELMNLLRERDASDAFKTGRLNMANAAACGMSRTAAYDALNRARSRRK